jgi:hypothetical protein
MDSYIPKTAPVTKQGTPRTLQDIRFSPVLKTKVSGETQLESLSPQQAQMLSPFVLGSNRQRKIRTLGSSYSTTPLFELSIATIPGGHYVVTMNIRAKYNVYGTHIEYFGPISQFAHIRLILEAFLEMEQSFSHKHNCEYGSIRGSKLKVGENVIRGAPCYIQVWYRDCRGDTEYTYALTKEGKNLVESIECEPFEFGVFMSQQVESFMSLTTNE